MTRLSLLLLLLLGVAGCDRTSAPPAPLALDQIPAVLKKTFEKAKPEAKDLVGQIVTAIQAPDYTKAYFQLQELASKPGLNKEQQSVASRAVLTVNGLLQSAESKGDVQAAETLKTYRVNK